MKIESIIIEWKEVFPSEAAEIYFDLNKISPIWEETEKDVKWWIKNKTQTSEKEIPLLMETIKEKFDEISEEFVLEEKEELSNRSNILNFIESIRSDEEGRVGYMLSSEEILDLILKNGNK